VDGQEDGGELRVLQDFTCKGVLVLVLLMRFFLVRIGFERGWGVAMG